MEKELNPDIIKATQISLGKYVKRPPLSEKLLKKPPFRFLHDIVLAVLKNTGFFEGLFEEVELLSDNVKDKESKILFLNKIISVLNFATGKALPVKPSKIVAGQEPEKTNELLQCLAYALDNNISSEEAVKKYKEGTKVAGGSKNSKDNIEPLKRNNEVKKLTSKSSEKLTSQKRNVSVTKTEHDKVHNNKSRPKENSTLKKESPPKIILQQTKTITKKTPQGKNQLKSDNIKKAVPIENISNKLIQSIKQNESKELEMGEQNDTDSVTDMQDKTESYHKENDACNSSYSKVENELNSSLSSQDLMEIEKIQINQETIPGHEIIPESNIIDHNTQDVKEANLVINQAKDENTSVEENVKQSISSNDVSLNKSIEIAINDAKISSNQEVDAPLQLDCNRTNMVRPTSVRPSSSRPGAPRLREKHENIVVNTDNLLVGKVNIIAENVPNEEEDDTSIILMEQEMDEVSASQDLQEQLQSSINEHGHLVQQILESQKELTQAKGKTEIEWQFGVHKVKEAMNRDIEQLKFNIQALSRVANPLGKLLDHIQEDVEVMRQELLQWTKTYDDISKELIKQKTENEDSLHPLHVKLKQLDMDIEEKHYKINDLKIIIHKNSSRIDKLLASGRVQ